MQLKEGKYMVHASYGTNNIYILCHITFDNIKMIQQEKRFVA